jgi:carbon storage regulator
MLILTRRVGEAILLDGGVRIVVLGTDGSGVRLGIEAPPSVGILREEVVQRIAEENVRAGATGDAREILRSLTEGKSPPVEEGPEGERRGGNAPGEGGERGEDPGEEVPDASSEDLPSRTDRD